MPEQTPATTDAVLKGKVLEEWMFPEFVKYERGPAWYAVTTILGLALFIYALINGNFLLGLIILLFALILFTSHRTEPLVIPFKIYEAGLQIGDKFYLYKDIDAFAIVYEPPTVKRLYIRPAASVLKRDISIPLDDKDPIRIRSLLLDVLDEDLELERESMNDQLSRMFKF